MRLKVKGINPTAKLINDMGINFSQKPNQNYQVIQSNQAQMITKPPSQNKYQRSSTHHQGAVVNRVNQQPTINNGLNINRRPPSGKSVNPQIRNSVNVRKSVNTRPTINQANYGMNNIIKKRILLI